MKFITTKKECESKINKNHVCSMCGRKIIAMKTVDNAGNPTYWSGCWHNDKQKPDGSRLGHFDHGVPLDVYTLAEKLVCEIGGRYGHMKSSDYSTTPEDREYWIQSQKRGWCDLLMTIEYLRDNPARKTIEDMLEAEYF
jgi:hypothetical protein